MGAESRDRSHVGSVGGEIVGRDKAMGAVSEAELDRILQPLRDSIGAAPARKRIEAEQKLDALQDEVAKGKAAADGVIAKLMDDLVALVPSAASAIATVFETPSVARIAGPATNIVLGKIRGE